MDLVALLCLDSVPPATVTGPPGLTPAQIAMRQRMLAMQARRMGVANPASASHSQGVRRGPSIRLDVWRLGTAPTSVWNTVIQLPIQPPQPEALESIQVLGICWSPDGERIAVHVCVTHVVNDTPHHAMALLQYSVYDGALLHTLCGPSTEAPSHCSMQWIELDPTSIIKSQALSMLEQLAPLAPATGALDDKNRWVGATQRQKPAGEPPSAGSVRGSGVLASIPALSKNKDGDALSLLLIAEGQSFHAWLDGTVPLPSTDLGEDVLSLAASNRHATAFVYEHDSSSVRMMHIPLPWDAPTVHLARLSSEFRSCLSVALDAAFYASHAWTTLVRPRASEWHAHWEELAKNHGVEIVAEWMTLLTTGHASPACEQLLAQLTEGAMIAMETDTKRGLKRIRRFAATNIMPACERMLILLTEWQGCTAWTPRYPPASSALAPLVHLLQTCHAVAMTLQEQTERELLAFDEFCKWWRMEQERQERLKSGDMGSGVIVHHDTLTVMELFNRGFIAPELDAILGMPKAEELANNAAVDADASDDSHAKIEPLFHTEPVTYENTLKDDAITASVEAALAWLDANAPAPAQPTDEQWQSLFHAPVLFPGPAASYRPRTLPGDPRTLLQQLSDVGHDAAQIFTQALMHTHTSVQHCGDAWAQPQTPLEHDDALRSAPVDMSRHISTNVPRPVVRALAVDKDTHLHMYLCDTELCMVHVSLARKTCTTRSTNVPSGMLIDGALTAEHAMVLYRASEADESTCIGQVSTASPAWPPGQTASFSHARSLAAFPRGHCLGLSSNRRELFTYVPPSQ